MDNNSIDLTRFDDHSTIPIEYDEDTLSEDSETEFLNIISSRRAIDLTALREIDYSGENEVNLKNYKIKAYVRHPDELEPWQLDDENVIDNLLRVFRDDIQYYLNPASIEMRQLDGDEYFFVAEVENVREENMVDYREDVTGRYNSITINELLDDYFDNLRVSSEMIGGYRKNKIYIAKNGARYIKLANGQTRFVSNMRGGGGGKSRSRAVAGAGGGTDGNRERAQETLYQHLSMGVMAKSILRKIPKHIKIFLMNQTPQQIEKFNAYYLRCEKYSKKCGTKRLADVRKTIDLLQIYQDYFHWSTGRDIYLAEFFPNNVYVFLRRLTEARFVKKNSVNHVRGYSGQLILVEDIPRLIQIYYNIVSK
jgi:hypothetical protein